jgi:hypothetical protein
MNKACLVICDNAATVKRLRDYSGRLVHAAEVTSAAKFSLSSSAPHQLLRYRNLKIRPLVVCRSNLCLQLFKYYPTKHGHRG